VNESRFDPEHSAAIRSMLIQTVDAEPERARRVHLRVALATVLAAIGLTFGGTAVAVAVTGGTLFDVGAPAPVETTSAPEVPSPTPTPTEASPPAPAAPAHPLVVTGDRILPHDLVSSPPSSPLWSVDLPVLGGAPGCSFTTVIDVSDGFALVQQGLWASDMSAEHCDVSANRLGVSLVDTAAGSILWSREWSWEPSDTSTAASLLGTSGRILLWDTLAGTGEVLDLATGETLGTASTPEGLDVGEVYPLTGDSGDVIYAAPRVDAGGQETGTWSVRRADPLDLGGSRWSYELEADVVAGYLPIGNSSSIVNVPFQNDDGTWSNDVLDVDTGIPMAAGVDRRSYTYFDGFTLRTSGATPHVIPTAIAGIDDAGNEFWSREDASGIVVGRVDPPGGKPAAIALSDGSDLALITSGDRLELVDGLTGETKWVADAAACDVDPQNVDRSSAIFTLQPDGVLLEPYKRCAFDYATGAPVDLGGRLHAGELGSAVAYEFAGGAGTGGQSSFDGIVPAAGTATAFDAVTGQELWTLPIASDERWVLAGGYVVGLSDGQMFGIGIG
jgi:hypothetical protein